jgi:hypothetical protein
MADWDKTVLAWRKSTQSAGGGCLEVAADGGVVFLRDSKRPDGPVLSVSLRAWAALLVRVRNLADVTP